MRTPCNGRRGPVVLRIAVTPGMSPEVVAAVVQELIRRGRARQADDMPKKYTPEEYRAAVREMIDPYMRAAQAAHAGGAR